MLQIIYCIFDKARECLWSGHSNKQYWSENCLLLFRYLPGFYMMHGFLLFYPGYWQQIIYVLWAATLKLSSPSMVAGSSQFSIRVPVTLLPWLGTVSIILSSGPGLVVKPWSEGHIYRIVSLSDVNPVEAAMRESQGCLSITANRVI